MGHVTRALGVGLLIALVATGCGSDEGPETVTVKQKVIVEKAPAAKKKRHRRSHPAPARPASEFAYCDQNIQARVGTTTCPFAENVFWTYWTSGEATSLDVWSPAAQANFTTTCDSDGAQVTCTTPDNAAVKFPEAALDRYSDAQAAAYASSHDLGPDPDEGLADDGGGGEDCQGYDPCITPGDDVDCEGGSGNGPRYVDGPVYVSGSDPYGLDSNGDGVGCEY
jgi:hypothetical protein